MSRRLALAVAACALVSCARPLELVTAPGAVRAGGPARVEAEATQAGEPWLSGSWHGVGEESNGTRWAMRLRFVSAADRCAEVDYPSIPCKTHWTCERQEPDGTVVGHEILEHGRCIDAGEVRLRREGNVLRWSWRKTGEDSASGELLRGNEEVQASDDDDTPEDGEEEDDE